MASSTTISGVASGIDWQATVDALMEVEQRKVTLLENRQAEQQNKLNAWRNLNTRLLALKTSMDSLEEANSFLKYTTSTSDSTKVSASADSSAQPGNYSVLVERLAGSARLVHQGWADENTTALNSSGADQVFAYSYGTGDDQVNIALNVPDGATLQDLRDLINQDAANPGVRATLLNDGSGGATAWHLVLTGEDTGADAQLVINDALTTLGDGTTFDGTALAENRAAQNAQFRVDGYPVSGWLESADNVVEDVIDGVTLTLKTDTDGEELQVTVSRDDSSVIAGIQSFVSAYNAIIEQINSYTSYDSEGQTMGVLLGDGGVNQLERELSNSVTRPIVGISAANAYQTLAQVGIKTGTGGLLSVDSEKLQAALEAHPEDVGTLFTFTSRTSDPTLSFFTRTALVPAGDVDVNATWDGDGNLLSATLGGAAATVNGNLITAAEDSDWAGLRILFRDPGSGAGSRSASISLSHGIGAALTRSLTRLTDSTDGLVQYQTTRFEDSVKNLDDAIEDMEDRLVITRQLLESQYLSMESTISNLQNQSNALSSLFNNNSSS